MLKAENLSQKVYDHLKSEIYAGRFPTRAPVFETRIADDLGVSRTPVREAVRMLQNEGLLEPQAGGGFLAHRITARDVQDAAELRAGIELVGVRLAAERITDAQRQELSAILERTRRAIRANLLEEVMRENERFHHFLAECAGSRLTSQLLVRVYDYIKTHRLLQRLAVHGDVRKVLESVLREHGEIAEAVVTRDPDLAVDRMRRHLEGVSVLYQSSLSTTPGHEARVHALEEEPV